MQGNSYDMYFIDWNMPGMDGMELARKIKEGGGGKSIVTMISAAEWNILEEEARDAGVDKFLPKPLFASAIADLINECIGSESNIRAVEEDHGTNLEGAFADYRILLAEDMEINREILQALLAPTKLTIDSAENGIRAVEMFSANPERYDMIFMDVQMPEMDGLEATRRIRQFESKVNARGAKPVPIIAMTANVFREDVEKCLESGMDDHVGKPLDMDEVLGRLRKYL
jgi:CheY-like chemotaxis protein